MLELEGSFRRRWFLLRLENLNLYKIPLVSSAFPGNLVVYNGEFTFRGKKYAVSERDKYIYHFYTMFYPMVQRFEFALPEVEQVFGPVRKFPLDWDSYESSSLVGRALRALLSVYGVDHIDPNTPFPYLPAERVDEPLAKIFLSLSGYPHHMPLTSWFVSPTRRFGFLVSDGSPGSFCVAHVFFAEDLSVSHIVDFQERVYSDFPSLDK